MPSLPIVQGFASTTAALPAGYPATTQLEHIGTPAAPYMLPDPRSRPRGDIELLRFYIPIAVLAVTSGSPAPLPTVADVQLYLISPDNEVLWVWDGQISLMSIESDASAGNALINADLVNPVGVSETAQPAFSVTFTLDQATDVAQVYIGSRYSPQDGKFQPAPGSAHYRFPQPPT